MVSFAVSKVELCGARYPAATAAESLALHVRRRVEDGACNLDGLVWAGVFAELSDQIAQHIGKQRDLVVAQFSTTGPIERAASEVVLLAAMQSYFEVHMYTLCGIPSVTLLGTVEDWQSIRRRAEVLGEHGARKWQQALLRVLDQLVSSARGKPDIGFWQSIYKLDDNSGGPYITGWLNVLFPYLTSEQERAGDEVVPQFNSYMARWQEDDGDFDGARFAAFPDGMMQTPFRWFTLTGELAMSFAGGFCGISQDAATGAVRPAIGWAATLA